MSEQIQARRGPDRGTFASNRGRTDQECNRITSRRLSNACVVEKNEARCDLGQDYCLKFRCETGIGIATKVRRQRQRSYQAEDILRGRRTLSRNSENPARLGTSGALRVPRDAQGAPKTKRNTT